MDTDTNCLLLVNNLLSVRYYQLDVIRVSRQPADLIHTLQVWCNLDLDTLKSLHVISWRIRRKQHVDQRGAETRVEG